MTPPRSKAAEPEAPAQGPEQHGSLAAALAAFQAAMPTVHKGKTAKVKTRSGDSYSYTYADLADVAQAAMPVLARHGLSFTTRPTRIDGGLFLQGVLRHTSGELDEGELPIAGGTPQELGSAITYARRYLLGCMTGIVTDDDDDGNVAQQGAAAASAAEQERQQREHQERVERERAARQAEQAKLISTATADADTVARLRADVVGYADTIASGPPRKEHLVATWREAGRLGALGCEVRLPAPWQQHTQGPEVCTLHQLIEGAQDVTLPPSGEAAEQPVEHTDPWATPAPQQEG